MKKLKLLMLAILNKGVFMMLLLGAGLLGFEIKDTIISFKPAVDFEDILNNEITSGDHVKGEVLFAYDCFASEETWTEYRSGARSASKTSGYYYAIPGWDSYIMVGLGVSGDDYEDMEELANQTYDYLVNGGDEPTQVVEFEGRVSKMEEDMEGLFTEYLEECGYTDSEIADMGDFLVIERRSFISIRIMAGAGLILFGLGVFFTIRGYKKAVREEEKANGYNGMGNLNGYQNPYQGDLSDTQYNSGYQESQNIAGSQIVDVELTSVGPNVIKVIKVVRETTGMGLKQAKDITDNPPAIIKSGIYIAEAESIKTQLMAEGAIATIRYR